MGFERGGGGGTLPKNMAKKYTRSTWISKIHRIKSLKIPSLSHNIMALDCVKSIFQDCLESLP